MATACILASIVAFLPRWGIPIFKGAPYLILGAAMASHEYTLWQWRRVRNRKLAEIDERETEADVEYAKRQAESAMRE